MPALGVLTFLGAQSDQQAILSIDTMKTKNPSLNQVTKEKIP